MASRASDLDDDLRPLVPTGAGGNYGLWAFLAILLLGGGWLYTTLSSAREAAVGSTFVPTSDPAARIASPPPLVLPAAGRQLPVDLGRVARQPLASPAGPVFINTPPGPPMRQPSQTAQTFYQPPPFNPDTDQPIVPAQVFNRNDRPSAAEDDANLVSATRLANPSMTVPQGTIIPAVLETAFDSTRPGGVRALVQRNIFSFDGTRVLIQRGSRLFGEYEAGINPGERRARITWTRLLRPDGVSINLASPASDPLGRAGVAGDVDSRFFARFGGALLQTVLGIGASVATSEATRGVIVALPGSTQNVSGQTPETVRPVLRIDHGTSVSVFVARDLNFSTVED